jgi:hypothetical protein
MTEEEARRYGYRGPPPPPVTAGTPYGVPAPQAPPPPTPNVVTPYRSASDNPGAVPVPAPPPPAPVAPVGPSMPPTVRRVAPTPVATPPPNPEDVGETMGVAATNAFETPQQRESRRLQLQAANEAINVINGTTTSQAQLQMQRGLNQAQAQQQSQAAGARGMGVAAARRMAARNIAELQQGGVGQAAELRAGEVAEARKQLADIAGQVRAQDIDTTAQGTAAIDRAKRNANDYEVSMEDLRLRLKLGMLTDERERKHLDEMERHNREVERLEAAGQKAAADALRAKMDADNKAFWGGIITTIGTVAGTVAGGPIGGAIAGKITDTAVKGATQS